MNSEIDSDLETVKEKLISGHLVVYPTETLWGLGCDALNEESVLYLNKIKNRKKNQPLSLLIRDTQMAQDFAHISQKQLNFMSAFWPGPVCFILPARKKVPYWIHGGTQEVGLRCSPHPFLKKVFRTFHNPIVTTSANESGALNCTSYKDLDWLLDKAYLVSNEKMDPQLYKNPQGSLILRFKNHSDLEGSDKIEIIRSGQISEVVLSEIAQRFHFQIIN